MEDVIVISDTEDEGSQEAPVLPTPWGAAQDCFDLTQKCVPSDASSGIIDLTATEDILPFTSPLNNGCSSPECPSPSSSGECWVSNGQASDSGTSNGSYWTDRRTLSPENVGESVLHDNVTSDKCLSEQMDNGAAADSSLTLQGWYPPAASASGHNSPDYTDYTAEFPNAACEAQPDAISTSPTGEEPDAQLPTVNRALMYKLQYFRRPPVNHIFHRPQERILHPAQIPQSRMRIVDSPREENFHQGTLHFLSEFVTAQHYPPKETVKHVIQSILLGAEEPAIKNEAYMVLMKVQKLHPATVNTVAWDWNLLTKAIGEKEVQTCYLFFQYVLQTLDDDFQIHVLRRNFQKSLCKAVLSYDKCYSNIKNVIDWLIEAVEKACNAEDFAAFFQWKERVVVLLQRMLSIAVEVDNRPVTSSNRIAELLFPKVIVLNTRQKREMLLKSTENILLRAKILEIIFQNSCETPPDAPLSLYKILYFIGNSMLLLENQGPEWQRWDELLHHICLLYFSLQRISTDHLQTPITDRTDKLLQRPQMYFSYTEDLTEADVMCYLDLFWKRTSFGSQAPEALQNRFQMLKSILLLDIRKGIQ